MSEVEQLIDQIVAEDPENLGSASPPLSSADSQLEPPHSKPLSDGTWKARLDRLIDEADDRYRELDRKEAIWKRALEMVKGNWAKAEDRVVLDIGGTKFATSKSTLLRFDNSFFSVLFGDGSWSVGEKGKFFIDRNPKGFDHFLDYLRDGAIELENLTHSDLNRFLSHCEYFMVPIPDSLRLEWSDEYCARQLKITDKKVLKTSIGPIYRYSGVLATLKNPPRFRIKVHSRKKGASLLIGLVPRSSFVDESVSLQSVGYFIDVATGNTLKCLNTEKNDVFKYRNRKIKTGSVVEVRLDLDLKQISFRVDDNDYGIAFTLGESEPLYPTVELHSVGDCVELI